MLKVLKMLSLLLILFVLGCKNNSKTNTYIDTVKEYQYEMNKQLANKETTPLNDEDFKNFRKLDFFPIDSTYKVVADIKLDENPEFFEMPTTTERKPMYATYGIATFTLNGKEVQLAIYQNKDKTKMSFYDHLFIPFMDETNSVETYGGGRYINPDFPENGKIVIDFNMAYNPYCVYNAKYSCPIPPKENHLPIAIKAGVKDYNRNASKK